MPTLGGGLLPNKGCVLSRRGGGRRGRHSRVCHYPRIGRVGWGGWSACQRVAFLWMPFSSEALMMLSPSQSSSLVSSAVPRESREFVKNLRTLCAASSLEHGTCSQSERCQPQDHSGSCRMLLLPGVVMSRVKQVAPIEERVQMFVKDLHQCAVQRWAVLWHCTR